jgi:hypothetical protein
VYSIIPSISAVIALKNNKHCSRLEAKPHVDLPVRAAFIPLGATIRWWPRTGRTPLFWCDIPRATPSAPRGVKEAHINTVAAPSAAIDASDPYTHGHLPCVAPRGRVGRALGLSTRDVEILSTGRSCTTRRSPSGTRFAQEGG